MLNGQVVALGSGNTLNLQGIGSEDDAMSGFSAINVANGASWTLSGAFVPTGNLAINVGDKSSPATALTMNGVISGTGSLTADGGGTLSLGAINSYTGGTTIRNGTTVQIGTAGALGAGTVTLDGGKLAATSSLDLTNSLTFASRQRSTVAAASGKVFGLGGDLYLGSAATVVFGSATENGTIRLGGGGGGGGISSDAVIVVAGGTLQAADAGLPGFILSNAASTTVDTGATLDLNGYSLTIRNLQGAGTLNTSAGGAAQFTSVRSGTFAGAITGSGQFVKTGPESLTLSGANSHTGGTVIAAGTLQVGDGGTTGSIVGNIVNNGALVFNRSNAASFSGAISGSGSVSQSGTGTLTLSGANTYSGGTTVHGGTLEVAASGALGIAGVTLAGGKLATTSSFAFSSQSLTFAAGKASTIAAATGSTLTLLSTLSLGANATATFGSASEAGVFHLGVAPVTVDGTAAVVVAGGTLRAGHGSTANAVFSNVVSTTVNSGATLDLNALSVGIRNLQGNGTLQTGPSGAQVTTLETGQFGGVIAGAGRLVKTGAGTLTLSGVNTYAGGTSINGGTVNAAVSGALGTGAVSVAASAGLLFTGNADAGNLSISAAAGSTGVNGGFIQFADNSSAGSATLTTQTQAGIDFRGNATAGNAVIENHGDTTIWFNANAGKATITNFAGGQTNFMDDGSAAQARLINETGGLIDFFDRATAEQATVVNKAGGRVRISKMTTPGLSIGSLEGAGNVALGNKALTVGGLNTSTEISGVISGVGGSIVKVGSGTLTLSGVNTYTGGTSINDGRVNASVSGALGTGAVAVNSGGVLSFSGTADAGHLHITLAAPSGPAFSGNVEFNDKSSAGNATFVANKYSSVMFNNDATAGNAVFENRGGDTTFMFNSTAGNARITNFADGAVYLWDFASAGQSTIINENGGKIGFNWRATADQATVVNKAGGEVHISSLQADGTAIGSLEGAGRVLLGNKALTVGGLNTSTEVSGVVSGVSGSIVKVGSGTLTLSGANTYTGVTLVNGGTLRVNNTSGSATGSGSVEIASGATLAGSGTIAGAVTVANGGSLAPGNSPGTLTTGELRLGSGSFLNYELGAVGESPLNDLIQVNGNLVLGGTLNVAQTAGGSFGPGLYRLIKYTGSLTDNGLGIGSAPVAPADLYVQTSVHREVNLINSAGVQLGFWDGGDAVNNNHVGGGSGTWRIGGPGGDGWSNVDGSYNATWKPNQFAMFGGTAGTVTVDNSGGAVSIGGAQFHADGYLVAGDALTLGNAQTIIKVGDGTGSGAAMTATISAPLTGAGGLTKDDYGTLVLTGASNYIGGTVVAAGVLQGNTTSLQGQIVNNANVTFDQSASGTFTGTMSGSGSLRKIGTGELVLAAANSYAGGTRIDGGSVSANVSGALGTGPVDVNASGYLAFRGNAAADDLRFTTGAASPGVNGGSIDFRDNTSAGRASFVNSKGGSVSFADNATAADAVFDNRGGSVTVWFQATAGKARIVNSAGGSTNLWDDGSAGQALIVNESTGSLDMQDRATAAQATVVNKAGGVVSIRRMTTAGASIGSLEGGGRVLLGDKALTTGGLNTSTEISGVISGVGGSLVKVGTGTLTLSGENTHTGGTALREGRLNLGHSLALGTGTLSMDDDTTLGFSADGLAIANAIKLTGNNDPVIDTGAFSGTLGGAITGGGFITKQGTGTLTLSGANTYTGATNVAQGTLKAGAVNTFSAASAHSVAAGATLDLAGFSQTVASLANSGTVSLAGATAGTTLTVKGAYVGNHGVLKLSTTLNGAGPSDRLVLDGPAAIASGKTSVQIGNLGGLGALTSGNGIEVITAQNGATTTAQTTKDAFSLAGGHVDAGAYEYRLHAADASGAGENWYLRSTTDAVTPGLPVVTYRPEAALYAALPSQLRQGSLAMLGDVRKRVGDDDVKSTASTPTGAERRAWARVLSTDIDIQQGGTVSPTSKGRLTGFQAGTDLLATANWRAGLYVGQLDGDARVSGFASGIRNLAVGRNDLRSQYVGVYGTYTADSGLYADVVVQSGRHRYTVEPMLGAGVGGKGNSLLGSIEVGQAFAIGASGWSVEPQLQLIHHHMDLGNSAIAGAIAQPQADSGWVARAGVRVKGQVDTGMGVLQPYGRVNIYKTSSGTDIARFVNGATTTDIAAPTGGTSTELAGGFTLALSRSTSLYGEVGKLWSSGGNAKVKSSVNGSLGVRVKW
ncbi:autotransporter outer membrane beta-barrel domain-containing protein [Acidovorax cavernicola]|uniref:Autotransporter outer membrane beta-barrel domain-containing protein n=1 Tax=Acidovorax cavernicola TaxID=1675792 RepID=A0A9X8GWB0_9BURK|nr:autotransporter outer membrane beta-barrel domain-containing protein [Acidovorax cavernicola]